MNILLLTCSFCERSHSSALAQGAASYLRNTNIESLDVAVKPPPFYNRDLHASLTEAPDADNEAANAARFLSDKYVNQLLKADALILGVPMHHFGIPGQLQAWMDQVARDGSTYQYAPNHASTGLVRIPALVIAASGERYSNTPYAQRNHCDTHVQDFLEFLGMDVTVVRVEGTSEVQVLDTGVTGIDREFEHLRAWADIRTCLDGWKERLRLDI